LDSNGWPTSDFGIVLQSDGYDINGTYKVKFTGKADVTPTATSGSVTNVVYNTTSNTQTLDLIINSGADQIMISFRNTNGGAKDIVVLQPGYDFTQANDFSTPYLNLVSRFQTLRFMDWACTNGNQVVNWSDRTPPTSPSYALGKGVPWEEAIRLCNTAKRDMWANIPAMANDDYVNQFAKLVLANLDPSLNFYFEYSNEVWNFGFSQATYALNQAVASVNAGDPDKLNYDNCNNQWYWQWRRTALRAKQIGDQFAAVFGASARPNGRIRPILAGQVVQILVADEGLRYLEAVWGAPSKFLYAIAGAPYFNLGDGNNIDGLTSQQVLTYLNASINSMAVSTGISSNNYLAAHSAYSTWYQLVVLGYEGGPDTFGPNSIQGKKQASEDPQMETLCVNYLTTWYNYGFAALNWFVAGASDYDTQYGTWGILEDMLNFDVPKLRAIDDVRTHSPPPITVGTALPAPGYNATQYVGHPDPDKDPYLRYLGNGSTFYFLFRSTAAGQAKVTVHAQTYVTGAQLEVGVNYAKQTLTMVDSTTTFGPQPTLTFTTKAGLNTLRLKVITNRGYDINIIDVQ
jgi:hypothetical protein